MLHELIFVRGFSTQYEIYHLNFGDMYQMPHVACIQWSGMVLSVAQMTAMGNTRYQFMPANKLLSQYCSSVVKC